jgi:hypothetical protein
VNLSALEWASTFLSLGTAVVYGIIFAVIVRRKIRSDLPFFLIYVVVSIVSNLFLSAFPMWGNVRSTAYFYSWWGFYTLLMLLEFGIMYEIFSNVLKPYSGLVDLGKMLFRWAALFLLLVAAIAAFSTTGVVMTKCLAAVALIERNLRLMQCGLLLLFFLLERKLGLSWRSYPVGLALGLGVSSALSLSSTFITLHIPSLAAAFAIADSGLTFLIVLYWSFCFARTQAVAQTVLDSPSKLIFQRWNEALQSTPMTEDKNPSLATVDSFLPGIEKTVDRVLARKIAH